MNIEQASKRRKLTLQGKAADGREENGTDRFRRGSDVGTQMKEAATREALPVARTSQPEPREGQAGPAGWRRGP